MIGMAASVYRPRLRLVPFVIDPIGEAVGDKKIDRSNGPSEKRDEKFYYSDDRTNEQHRADADSVNGRVG
jgi:hypothetical protein